MSHSSGFVFLSLYVTFVFCVSASDLCLFSPLFLFIFARRPLGQKSVSGFIIQAPSFIYNSRCWCLLSRKLKDESGIFDFLLVKMYFFFFFSQESPEVGGGGAPSEVSQRSLIINSVIVFF